MPVPVREIVMAVLGIVGAIVAAIQSWKKKQVTTALADVVRGGELVKKTSPEAAAAFKDAQNSAQTTSTVAMVTAIRRQLA
jgi:hypothetical protein